MRPHRSIQTNSVLIHGGAAPTSYADSDDQADLERRRATLGLRWSRGQDQIELVDASGHVRRGTGGAGDPVIRPWTSLEVRSVGLAIGRAARADGRFVDHGPAAPVHPVTRWLRERPSAVDQRAVSSDSWTF